MWKCFCNTTDVLLISAWLYITFLGFERSFNLQIYLKRRKAIVKSMVKVNGVNGKLDHIKLMHKCSSYLERAYLNERTDCILQLECSFDFLVFLFSYSFGSSRWCSWKQATGVLITGKHLCWSLLLITLRA